VVETSKLTVVDCWAVWCSPCRVMDASLASVREKYQQVEFVKVNVGENTEFANKHNIVGIPTLLFMKDRKEVGRIVGAVTSYIIEAEIQNYLGD